jgi:pyridoxal phosphate enzyme (YggS family)
VAVSKLHPVEAVTEAAVAGQVIFGENYVQELIDKAGQLPRQIEWHMIGHLQSNKVKYLPGIVSMIHTVDRLSLAQEIDRQWREKQGSPCEVLVQVNVSGEATKSGTTAANALELVRQVGLLPFIRVRGLMTMPPFFDDPEAARPYFRELRLLAEQIRDATFPGVEMAELSMGMSGDFEVAIEEGATLVRVGTAIFGER